MSHRALKFTAGALILALGACSNNSASLYQPHHNTVDTQRMPAGHADLAEQGCGVVSSQSDGTTRTYFYRCATSEITPEEEARRIAAGCTVTTEIVGNTTKKLFDCPASALIPE